jgi:hypothetical protein
MENVPYFGPSHPQSDDTPEPGEDVKEPPLPRGDGSKEQFPRKGDVEAGVEDGASID